MMLVRQIQAHPPAAEAGWRQGGRLAGERLPLAPPHLRPTHLLCLRGHLGEALPLLHNPVSQLRLNSSSDLQQNEGAGKTTGAGVGDEGSN